MKKLKFILPVSIVFFLLIIVKIFTPEPTDWSFSFSKNDKIPFGSYILFNELNKLFPNKSIESTNLPFYNINSEEKLAEKNILIICYNFNADELDSKILLKHLENGNNIFIASSYFNSILTDSFKVFTSSSFLGEFDSTYLNFCNSNLKEKVDYVFVRGKYDNYFSSFDTTRVKILGINKNTNPNFIKFNLGKGNLYLHSLPTVFTNYNILSENRDYIFKALSYLPVRDVIWDEYYKEVNKYQSTPIRYILSQPALKWSYFTFIISLILFVIFKGRRDQRIIPIIKPLENSTVEFVSTLGNLYFNQGNHKNIAEKKVTYFLDFVKSKFNLKSVELDDQFAIQLAEKSSVNIDEIKDIFRVINLISVSKSINKSTLLELNSIIENFYIKTGVYGK